MSLFGNTAGTGGSRSGGSGGSSKNLIEFRAGKMSLQGRMVHPDKRKGLLYVYQSDDGLMHLGWKERTKAKANPEDDLIIFPEDAEYKHVPQCTTGRVYVLKFKTGSRKLFFWLQEPKTDKDEENCKTINDLLNNPPAPGSSRAAGSGAGPSGLPAELANLSDSPDLQNILSGMSQQQLMHLLSGMGGMGGGSLSSLMSGASTRSSSASVTSSTPTPAPHSTTTESNQMEGVTSGGGGGRTSSAEPSQRIQLSDLQNILSSFASAGGGGSTGEAREVDLTEGLNGELLIPLLAKPEIQERLVPYLPQGESLPSSEHELRQTIHSPQFHQAVRGFSAAFSSGQLGPLIAQFNLGEDAVTAANTGDIAAFARALQENAERGKQEENRDMDTDK